MGRLNAITRLPADVRAEIDARLVAEGFTGYVKHADELRHRGFDVSKSALHRYGKSMEKRLQMLRAAREISAAGVDADITAELCGDASLVVVIDRTYGRARLISVPVSAAEAIRQIKRIGGAK
jgi:hypothetical protein